MNVNGSRGPMVIDIRIQIHPRGEEHLQSREASFVNREAFVGDQSVVNQSSKIDGADRHAAHIGIAQDIIQVITRVAA